MSIIKQTYSTLPTSLEQLHFQWWTAGE